MSDDRPNPETLLALADAQITIPQAISKGAQIHGAPEAIQRMLQILPPRQGETGYGE